MHTWSNPPLMFHKVFAAFLWQLTFESTDRYTQLKCITSTNMENTDDADRTMVIMSVSAVAHGKHMPAKLYQ
jgi:hypothetical protein